MSHAQQYSIMEPSIATEMYISAINGLIHLETSWRIILLIFGVILQRPRVCEQSELETLSNVVNANYFHIVRGVRESHGRKIKIVWVVLFRQSNLLRQEPGVIYFRNHRRYFLHLLIFCKEAIAAMKYTKPVVAVSTKQQATSDRCRGNSCQGK